ncbi:MAG: tRNA (cytidine(34)-2'-O)-methyltransferase [Pseudomonadota bacterium]
MDVVLVHPEIPWNTGNVGRTCVAVRTPLHLVAPLGFDLSEKSIRRSGLDYWDKLDLTVHASVRHFLRSPLAGRPVFFFSRFARRSYWKASYPRNAVLVFGSETRGLPPSLSRRFPKSFFRIPTDGPVRSLNLSSAVGIVLFEALRQQQKRSRHGKP